MNSTPSPRHPATPHLIPRRHLLLSGISIPEIAAWTGADKTLIYNQRQALRKASKTLPDARVYNGGKRTRPLASPHHSSAPTEHVL